MTLLDYIKKHNLLLSDIAKEIGVSISLISRYNNGHVSETMTKKIKEHFPEVDEFNINELEELKIKYNNLLIEAIKLKSTWIKLYKQYCKAETIINTLKQNTEELYAMGVINDRTYNNIIRKLTYKKEKNNEIK